MGVVWSLGVPRLQLVLAVRTATMSRATVNVEPPQDGMLRKSERAKKQEILEKLAQLEARALGLEREKATHLYSKRHEFRSRFCSLEEAELKLSNKRKIEKQELKQQIGRIQGSVKGFQRMLADMKPGPAFVEKLKETLEEIEASIVAFKEKQRELYELLLLEERTVGQEVSAFEKKLESWLSARDSRPPTVATTGSVPVRGVQAPAPSSMPPAVVAFERFLQQTGGRQGGWDDYDHQTFLRTRNKFNGRPTFIEAAARDLPTKTVQEIEQHEQWYTEYCALMESKKKVIEEWRSYRESSKAEQLVRAEQSKEVGDSQSRTTKEEALAREKEERVSKLSVWKAQKELIRLQAEKEEQRNELLQAQEMAREKERQAAIRRQVQEYQQQREQEQRVLEEQQKARRGKEQAQLRVASRELYKFRERDLRAAEAKKEMLKAKEMKELEKAKQLEKLKEQVEVRVSRDPSRVFKLTAGLEERKKAGPGSGMTGAAPSMPKRAVPSWRQGV